MAIKQCTNSILMVRPKHFGYNTETASNNTFQTLEVDADQDLITNRAIKEFDNAVEILRSKSIHVIVVEDTEKPVKPDAIFPNNWFSTHNNGMILRYPLFSPKRRLERRGDIIEILKIDFIVHKIYSFEYFEEQNTFLEGTGSLVLDRINKIAYACLSPRTDYEILNKWCVLMDYSKVTFDSLDQNGIPIFHTNVMMSIGESVCVICLESIKNEEQKSNVLSILKDTGKEIVDISIDQVNSFAGNVIQLQGVGQKHWVMATSAYRCLTQDQIKKLSKEGEIIVIPVPTIQKYGGGGIRCMIAGVFLERK